MIGKLRIALMGLTAVSLLVPAAAFAQEQRPEHGLRAIGEIVSVEPEQGAFTLLTRRGEQLEFQTGDRTRFRSRDGSVASIEDLQVGMHALVGAVQRPDGSLLALVVAVGTPEDRPELDLRAAGVVIAIDGRNFTLQRRNGEQLTALVDQNTKFKGIGGFDELEVGMLAAVGAVETDSGLLAVWLGAREKVQRRPHDNPQRDPADRPPESSAEPQASA